MNAALDHARRPDALRPIYEGMNWSQSRSNASLWKARSDTTPITYAVEEIDDGQWESRQGFPEMGGRPNVMIGRFASLDIAMTSCEHHDYRFWASEVERAGLTPVFAGSPNYVSDFVSNLLEHEKDELLNMISGGYELPNSHNFTQVASFFEAKKAGLKQERSGDYTLTLTIPAVDLPMWLMQTAPGAKVVAGMAEIESTSQDEWQERAEAARKLSWSLVQDNTFQAWLAQKYDRWDKIATAVMQDSEAVERAVTDTLRRMIGIPSRGDLKINRDAVHRLEKYAREFYLDCSRGFTGTLPGQNADS